MTGSEKSILSALFVTGPASVALLLAGCATTQRLPEEVLVPVPVPCEIEQVEETELPQVRPDMNVFEAAQVRMAQLKLVMAENVRLRAANTNPCPTEIPQ